MNMYTASATLPRTEEKPLRGRIGESARQVEWLFESLLAEAFS